MTISKNLFKIKLEVKNMYCEHCGKKIDLDSNFCEHCGEKVNPKKEKFIITREHKILLSILIFGGFVFLFLWELKYFNSPTNAINTYLKNWSNKNYDSILENLNMENTKFINQQIFEEITKDNINYNKYKIDSCHYQNNKENAICNIIFESTKDSTTREKSFTLEREKNNRLGIFANWKIKENDIKIITNFKLYLPEESTAVLINQELNDYYNADLDKNGYQCYIIPQIIQGKYPLKVKMKNGMVIDKEININKPEYTYQFNVQDTSAEFQNELKVLGTSVIETIYQGAVNKTKFEDLNSTYNLSKIKENYTQLTNDLANTNLTELKVKEIKISKIKINNEGKIEITYQMRYNYKIKYQKNGKEETYEGSSNDSFTMKVKNMELQEIESIESLVTYFSKKN